VIHPRLTPVGSTTSTFLATIGTYGSWDDLTWTTRWGDGACGMFEASWTMPLPADFEHPLLRRGVLVELMAGPYRIGSPLILSEPTRGTGVDNPWQFTATGIGREVEGDNTFIALDGAGNTNNQGQTVVDQAIARGWRIAGRDANIPAGGVSTVATTDDLKSVGAVLTEIAEVSSQRWGVGQDNLVRLLSDPTSPTWTCTPVVPSIGTADDDYATAVYGRYYNSGAGNALATVSASSSAANTEAKFGRREFPVDLTPMGPMPTSNAQTIVNTILAKSKGRLAWTSGLTLTSNELLSIGGVPADLSLVEAGQMVRIQGVFSDLLEYNGQTYLDFIIGETRYTYGEPTIDINPLGLAARDLARIVEEVTGMATAA
jgi:hypothetical protein